MILDDSSLHQKAIIDSMSTPSSERFFASFGRHLCNDALHVLCIFPGMPTIDICNSDEAFEQFCEGLFTYMAQFGEPEYLSACCNGNSSQNILAFQESVDTKYSAKYMQVFRKAVVNVPVDLYNRLSSLGLLDPNHHIGMSLYLVF